MTPPKREFLIEVRDAETQRIIANGLFVSTDFCDALMQAHLAAGDAIAKNIVAHFTRTAQVGQMELFEEQRCLECGDPLPHANNACKASAP